MEFQLRVKSKLLVLGTRNIVIVLPRESTTSQNPQRGLHARLGTDAELNATPQYYKDTTDDRLSNESIIIIQFVDHLWVGLINGNRMA